MWEYNVQTIKAWFKSRDNLAKLVQEKCNELGKLGWELVNFQTVDGGVNVMLVFKREI